jgi:NADPH-dependent 2,4-dienoyl-CoA reductase/sulfur reductase-like enzyme
MSLDRRQFVKLLGAGAAFGATASLSGCATTGAEKASGRVVVIGAGFGGATAAKYIRKWATGIEVVLIERNPEFISCPFSNRVLAGEMTIKELTVPYDKLASNRGVTIVRDEATAIDPAKREVRLARGNPITYDRLIVAPGIDFMYETIPGLNNAAAQEQILHAWKAGAQTVALRKQLEAMPDGGVVAIHIPKSPYRCPPGPYERSCQIAFYLKNNKPKSKVLILDANEDVQSKKGLFMKAWDELYKGIVEYRPNSELQDVDAKTKTAKLVFGDVKADVLNVIPPQRAGSIAQQAGLITANNRWCGIDYLNFESVAHKNIHVLGDAILAAPAMPKSGHMANQHGKIVADAVIALLAGRPVNDEPMIANTCYSWISDKEVVHVASVHKYDKEKKTLVTVPGSGGLSAARNVKEGMFAIGWAENIWADMLT